MADFKTAVLISIDPEHEGGYQCNPHDSGNWTSGEIGVGELKGTKYGISAAIFPSLDIKNLTPDQAVCLYQDRYWKQYYSQIDSQQMANKLFDLGLPFGVGTAIKILQEVLKVPVDGVFGPNTLAELNSSDPVKVLSDYKEAMVQRALNIGAANPEKRRFVSDWIRRINS